MILISHRGNVNGINKESENTPNYIDLALSYGFDVEVDIWFSDNSLWLGHDKPENIIDFNWVQSRLDKLWIHCKNIESVLFFKNSEYEFNYFWHQEDDIALTSNNILWTFPGKKLTKQSIAVLPETTNNWDLSECLGVCSDFIKKYK